MTAFAPSQLPSSVNTVEKLNAWSAMVLAAQAGTARIVEEDGYAPTYIASVPIGQTPAQGIRLTTRCSLEMEPGYSAATTKLWTQVKEQITGVSIPAVYTTN
jgi:hypothetical protein